MFQLQATAEKTTSWPRSDENEGSPTTARRIVPSGRGKRGRGIMCYFAMVTRQLPYGSNGWRHSRMTFCGIPMEKYSCKLHHKNHPQSQHRHTVHPVLLSVLDSSTWFITIETVHWCYTTLTFPQFPSDQCRRLEANARITMTHGPGPS